MPGMLLQSRTANRLYIYLTGLNEERWNNYGTSTNPRDYKYNITLNGVTRTVNKGSAIGTTAYGTFSGLTRATEYIATAIVSYYDSDGNAQTETFTQSFVTTGYARPSDFSWTTQKTSGGNFSLTATEWNALQNAVKEFHKYSLGYYSDYAYPMTSVSQGDIFYATLFNEVRFAIGSLISTGVSRKYSHDIIYADDLNTIVNKLNMIT